MSDRPPWPSDIDIAAEKRAKGESYCVLDDECNVVQWDPPYDKPRIIVPKEKVLDDSQLGPSDPLQEG